jgi:serine/threonine protein kinase
VDPGKFRDDSSVSLKKEIEILKMLEQHERVVKIVEILEDVEFTGTWCTTCACTQYVPSGPDGHCKNCGSHDGHHHSSHEETKLVTLIVQELAVGGELFNIVLHNGALSENIARYYFLQLLEGVQFCHSKGIYHRDL